MKKMTLNFGRFCIYFFLISFLLPLATYAGLNPAEITKLTRSTPGSIAKINHQPWQNFLDRYVKEYEDGITRVDYAAVSSFDKKELGNYLTYLSNLPLSTFNANEQRAYWINLHNATVIKMILNNYPIISVKEINHPYGKLDHNPWKDPSLKVDGVILSIDEINSQIFKKVSPDPRLYYVLNKGTIGSPNLQTQAFTAQNTETLLEEATKRFINCPRGVKVINHQLIVNEIYRSHLRDFHGDHEKVITHLIAYADEPLKNQLKDIHEIQRTVYNWHLNDLHHKHYE